MPFLNTIQAVSAQTATGGDTGTSVDFVPIILHVLFATVFVVVMVAISRLLGPKRPTAEKIKQFVGGIPSHGDAREPISVKYFLVAILFVLFDVEIVFFYPYAVNLRHLGWTGFWEVLLFVSLFSLGLMYIYKKGALKWED